MQIEEHIPLATYTTFHIGGPARYFVVVRTSDDLQEALEWAHEENQRVLILGGGSNVLIDDAGFDGLVIKIELAGIELLEEGDKTLLVAGAGESWDALVERAVEEELWGIENLSGIPGTVGGAIAGSIGAYGQAVSQTTLWVEVLDVASGEVKKLSNADCKFGYRESLFSMASKKKVPPSEEKKSDPDGVRYISPEGADFFSSVIVRAAFNLSKEPKPDVSYKDLKARFNDSSLDLGAIREAILEIRKGKFPDLSLEGTAGSFFKNPIVPAAQARELKEQYPALPLFDMPETAGVKVPLAWLIDHVLKLKGTSEGGARLFEMQPLVIAAQKNCTARDVRSLAQLVKEKVKEKFNFEIEAEVKII